MSVCHTLAGPWPASCDSWPSLLAALSEAWGEKVVFERADSDSVWARSKHTDLRNRVLQILHICSHWAKQRSASLLLQERSEDTRARKRGPVSEDRDEDDDETPAAAAAAVSSSFSAACAAAAASSSSSSSAAAVAAAGLKRKKASSKEECKIDYATDIEAPLSVVKAILAACPAAVEYGAYGRFTLERYLPLSMRGLRRPDERRRFPVWFIFLSPPVHGVVHTAAHMDGNGELLSMQIVPPFSNADMLNRVAWWQTSGFSLDAKLNEELHIEDTGGSDNAGSGKWQYHHGDDTEVNGVTAAMRILQLPKQCAGQCRPLASEYYAHSLSLARCTLLPDPVTGANVLIHAPGCIHCYEKELREALAKAAGRWSSDTTPLVGFQCTSMLFGHDLASATASLTHMRAHAEKLRDKEILLKSTKRDALIAKGELKPCTPTIDLQLFCIFLLGLEVLSASESDKSLQQHHRRALKPFLREAIEQEVTTHAHIVAQASNKMQPPAAAAAWTPHEDDAEGVAIHLTCICDCCRTHILYYRYAVDVNKKAEHYCGRCVKQAALLPSSWTARFQLPAGTTLASLSLNTFD